MSKIDMDSLVELIISLRWKSDNAYHTDCYQANGVNIWRDYLSPELRSLLLGKGSGERFEVRLAAGDSVPGYDPAKVFNVKVGQFENHLDSQTNTYPQIGRFYPKGILKDVTGVFRANIQPFRCVGINNGDVAVDFNHPMAGRDMLLSCVVGKVEKKSVERGGTSIDWIETLAEGPGMQARWQNQATDYFTADAFSRNDERPDNLFYEKPRFVQHIDSTAIEVVRNLYGRFLSDGMQVLDLMSSWRSHLPPNMALKGLTGLGLNADELKRNRRLTSRTVQNLNQNKVLPYADETFDAVLNTVSVEYLTDPVAVFSEVSRVLRPQGYFAVTFSNRWFPTKAVRIWEELHDFERMGLVMEYFLRSGGFSNLQTYSMRGLPRPHSDKYYPDLRYSDPVYAVWGQKRSH